MSEVCVVIPTYNEADNIQKLIDSLERIAQDERMSMRSIVVDDSSPDETADIAGKLNSRYGNISILRRPGKLGLGSAARNGIKVALSFPNCDRIITMDADFSHDPVDIPRLTKGSADVVIASRYIADGGVEGWGLRRNVFIYLAAEKCEPNEPYNVCSGRGILT